MKKVKYILYILFIISLSIGCNKNRGENRNNKVLDAYRLIDEQRTDEAIGLLEEALLEEPNNTEYSLVLASAYAHKAGIKIQKLIPALSQSDKLKKLNEKWQNADKGENASNRVNQSAKMLAKMLTNFSGLFEVYSAVPVVDKSQAIYLGHSIRLLNSLGNKLKSEDVLYRVMLEVVLLKFYIAENFIGEFLEPQTKDKESCKFDLSHINAAIIKIGKLMIDIYNDIGFTNPRESENMKSLSVEMSDSISSLTIATTAVTVLDETANIFLKQTAIQNGFGKIIKCDGGF